MPLHFYSDLELAIFLRRHLSKKFDTRTLTLLKYEETISRMEKAAGQSSGWCLCESKLPGLFEEDVERLREAVLPALRGLTFEVSGEEESAWIYELLGIPVHRKERPSNIERMPKEIGPQADLLLCLLSATVDPSDSFAATRLLAAICPEALAPLKARSKKTGLNLVQCLLSFAMTARIHDAGEDDAVLASHVDLLKRFDAAVEEMHSRMHELDNEKLSLTSMLNVAANFLCSFPSLTNDAASIRKAQSLIISQIKELIDNQKAIEAAVPCENEDAPECLTRRDRVCRALLDRFAALEVSGTASADLSMTPAFKTPLVTRLVVESVEETIGSEEECATPTKENGQHSFFLCNTTPTPRRDHSPSIYQELLDEEKENMDPNKKLHEEAASMDVVPSKKAAPLEESTTPVRAKPLASRRSADGSVLGEKKFNSKDNVVKGETRRRSQGAEGGSKKAKAALAPVAGQKSIMSFFAKK